MAVHRGFNYQLINPTTIYDSTINPLCSLDTGSTTTDTWREWLHPEHGASKPLLITLLIAHHITTTLLCRYYCLGSRQTASLVNVYFCGTSWSECVSTLVHPRSPPLWWAPPPSREPPTNSCYVTWSTELSPTTPTLARTRRWHLYTTVVHFCHTVYELRNWIHTARQKWTVTLLL